MRSGPEPFDSADVRELTEAQQEEMRGLYEGELVVRLNRDSAEHAAAIAVDGAHLFDPASGRPMKDWICLPVAARDTWSAYAKAARETPRG